MRLNNAASSNVEIAKESLNRSSRRHYPGRNNSNLAFMMAETIIGNVGKENPI